MLTIANRNTIDSKRGGLTGLDKIFASYGFLNMWSSENLTVDGTNTTLHDYAGEHDLVNPAAANQPTYNATDSDFNNLPSLTFDGTTDYNYKSVSNWRGSDSSGVFIGVFKIISGVYQMFVMTGDEAANNDNYFSQLQTNTSRFTLKYGGTANTVHGTSNVKDASSHVVANASTGSAYKIIVDGVNESLTVLAGADNGNWMDQNSNRDNVLIGGYKTSAMAYANIDWAFSGYLPYISDANVIALQEELKTYYGI